VWSRDRGGDNGVFAALYDLEELQSAVRRLDEAYEKLGGDFIVGLDLHPRVVADITEHLEETLGNLREEYGKQVSEELLDLIYEEDRKEEFGIIEPIWHAQICRYRAGYEVFLEQKYDDGVTTHFLPEEAMKKLIEEVEEVEGG